MRGENIITNNVQKDEKNVKKEERKRREKSRAKPRRMQFLHSCNFGRIKKFNCKAIQCMAALCSFIIIFLDCIS